MTRTIRTIATNVEAKATIAANIVMYSAFGNRNDDDEQYRHLLVPSPTPSSTHSFEDNIRPPDGLETWEFRVQTLRAEQDRLFQEEGDAREVELTSLHQLHTFGKYAQRKRTHRHGITRDNLDHHIVHIQPPMRDAARLQKASVYNASSAGRATWEQETGVIRTSPARTVYEYSASIYSQPTCQQAESSVRSRPSPQSPVLPHSSSRASLPESKERPGAPETPTSPIGSTEQGGKAGTCSSDAGSNASSLMRRGAVRRRANPLLARPVADDFERNEIIGKNHSP